MDKRRLTLAEASGRQDRQRIRDVPRSCICEWDWARYACRWVRVIPVANCPWHTIGGYL
jgi:hypothetical protein